MLQEKLDRMRKSQEIANTNMNKKQQKTKTSILKETDEFDKSSLEKNMRTFITHNKGGKWELVKAPAQDSEGGKIDCFIEEGCSLNLEIYSSNGRFAPPYS
jgi:Sortilin, neurotensin receptor 3,